MSKNAIRGYMVLAVILVVFSVIAFASPFNMTVVFWLAYVFGVIAIAYQIYVFKISFSGDGAAKSKFYGFPIARIGVIYLIVQMGISIVEMYAAAFIPVWVALIIDIIPAAMAVVGCIAADAMRDEVMHQDVQLKKDVSDMRALQLLSASLIGQCSDSDLRIVIQNMADEFKYSDPVSSNETKEIESELEIQLKELQKAIIDGDAEAAKEFCEKLVNCLSERNRICALNK